MLNTLPSNSVGGAGGSQETSVRGVPYPFPTMPTAVTGDGYSSGFMNIIPHNGTAIDNVRVPTAFDNTTDGGGFTGFLGETQIWNVVSTDLNAACDGFTGVQTMWYDNVNDQLWVFGLDTAASPNTIYTAYITLETGVVTNVGNVTLTTQPTDLTTVLSGNIYRPNIDSGNFTLYFVDRTVIIDDSDGSEVSNTASTNARTGVVGSYTIADGALRIGRLAEGNGTGGDIGIHRSNETLKVPTPNPMIGVDNINFLSWGDKVKVVAGSGGSTGGCIRTFNRTQFDIWVRSVAMFGGLAL